MLKSGANPIVGRAPNWFHGNMTSSKPRKTRPKYRNIAAKKEVFPSRGRRNEGAGEPLLVAADETQAMWELLPWQHLYTDDGR